MDRSGIATGERGLRREKTYPLPMLPLLVGGLTLGLCSGVISSQTMRRCWK